MQFIKSSADVYLEEADELLSKGDVLQASEKYYKAAEEAIKILASLESGPSSDWNVEKINRTAFELSLKFEKWIIESWGSAVALVTVNLDIDQVKKYREKIVKLVQLADERLNKKIVERG
jgi:C4-dicarboxylate-specific signal transduction histidine kinase